jgi:hypothetical protein
MEHSYNESRTWMRRLSLVNMGDKRIKFGKVQGAAAGNHSCNSDTLVRNRYYSYHWPED